MFDVSRIAEIIKGMLLQPQPTWQAYLAENKSWRQTLTELALPLIVGSLVLSLILSFLFPGDDLAMSDLGLGGLVFGLVGGVVGILVSAFLLALLAGLFKGQNDLDRAVAALTLTGIPAYVGIAIEALPLIGVLAMMVATIYSIVLLYRIIPDAHGVPQGRRVIHFISFLIAGAIALIVLSVVLLQILGPLFLGD